MKDLIQKLVEAVSPSGYEAPVRSVIRAEIEAFADEMRVDALGNLIALKGPTRPGNDSQKIMLAAHMDEIGVIATHIDEQGFVRFTNICGVRALNCVGGRVRFLNGVAGVIGMEHPADAAKAPTMTQLYIDVGASSRLECPVKVGDVGVFDRPFLAMGDRLVAKAMDDRIGVAVLVEALRSLKQTPHQVYFVFSTQEEVGLRGATTAAYGLDPDLGISVDVTRTGDAPKDQPMSVSLGKGPAIKVRDGGMLSDPRVVDWMVRTAEKTGLPYQLEVLEAGTTDARAMQISRAGMPAGCVSIPCRYVHSPSEMVDLNDVHNAVRLIVGLVSEPVVLAQPV
jgi:tetrahedral aminopeptidase